MANNKKTTLLFFIFVIIISFLIRTASTHNFLDKLILDLSKLPLSLINLSFLPMESIISLNKSLRENLILKKENQQLKIILMQLRNSNEENKRLKKLLSFKQESEFSLVVCKIIASDVSNFRKTLIINKGKRHNIKSGNPVITPEGMVGVVATTGNSSSRIMLINDIDFSMAAKVRRSEAIGVVSGSLEGMCKLKYLNLNDDIEVKDEIISAGRNSRFPAGIPIGEVVQISKDNLGLTNIAIIKPKVKLSSLEEVLVIVNE